MTIPTEPVTAPLAPADFDDSGVSALVAGLNFRDWGTRLLQAVQVTPAADGEERGAVLQLLARACALRLVPLEKPPFLDGWLPGIEQPVSYDGFTDADIDRLATIAPTAAPPALRAFGGLGVATHPRP